MKLTQVPAHPNNYGKRYGHKIDKIILHWIAGTLESCDATFQSPTRKASAHYGIANDQVHQYVPESEAAWHAGNLTINRESISIEHEGGPNLPISEQTYHTSASLVKDICDRHDIPLDRDHIKGHREISATQCPGTLDIDKIISLARQGDQPAMTDYAKRVLEYLTIENSFSEGDVREGMEDFKRKKDRLKAEAEREQVFQTRFNDLLAKYEAIEAEKEAFRKLAARCQSQLEIANGMVEVLTEDKNKNWMLYKDKNDEFNALKTRTENPLSSLLLFIQSFKKWKESKSLPNPSSPASSS